MHIIFNDKKSDRNYIHQKIRLFDMSEFVNRVLDDFGQTASEGNKHDMHQKLLMIAVAKDVKTFDNKFYSIFLQYITDRNVYKQILINNEMLLDRVASDESF